MAVSLSKKKPVTKVAVRPTGYAPGGISYAKPKPVPKPTYGANSFYAPMGAFAAPVAVAPKAPVVPAVKPIGVTQPVRKSFQDYIAEGIPGDWEVEDAETAFANRMSGLRSAFTTDIRDALINLGLPQNSDINQQFGGYIDQDTITKAIGNKYSAASQIAQQEAVQKANATAALAARGSLFSGSTTNRLTGIAAEGEKGRWQAVQDFLSGARGGLKGLGDAETGLLGNIATARANAAARLAQQYGWDQPDEVEAPGAPAPVVPVAKPVPKETPAQRALRLRSEALNKRYGLGKK